MIKEFDLKLTKLNKIFIGLMIFYGFLLVSSASALESERIYQNSFFMVRNHLISVLVGLMLLYFIKNIIKFDLILKNLKYLAGGMSIVLFGLLTYGNTFFGSTRWLDLGFIQFQPSEFAKPIIFLWVAKEVSEYDKKKPLIAQIVKTVFLPASMCLFILLQPDFATSAVIVFVVLVQLFISRINILIPLLSTIALSTIGYFVLNLEGYRNRRFQVWRDGICDTGQELLDACYQVHQSRIAISSGGLFGLGPGTSRSRWGSLPSSYSDFISSIIGEEYGFFGFVLFLIFFLVVILTFYLIGLRSQNEIKKIYIFGITTWILIQSVFNLGATVYLLPVTGIVLPFVSYGGSAMVSIFIAMGIMDSKNE